MLLNFLAVLLNTQKKLKWLSFWTYNMFNIEIFINTATDEIHQEVEQVIY